MGNGKIILRANLSSNKDIFRTLPYSVTWACSEKQKWPYCSRHFSNWIAPLWFAIHNPKLHRWSNQIKKSCAIQEGNWRAFRSWKRWHISFSKERRWSKIHLITSVEGLQFCRCGKEDRRFVEAWAARNLSFSIIQPIYFLLLAFTQIPHQFPTLPRFPTTSPLDLNSPRKENFSPLRGEIPHGWETLI